LFPIPFATIIITILIETMFGCSALTIDLSCAQVLLKARLKETFAFMSRMVEHHDSPSLEIPPQHPRDSFPP